MAVILTVRSGDAEVPPLTFDAPRIVIGRAKSCDLRLPDPSVSPRHASLRQRGNDYLILDEASTNGTFVGNVRLPPGAPRIVRSGDLVRVGRVWLQVELQATIPDAQPVQRAAEIALRLVAGALAAEGRLSSPRVVVNSGPDASRAAAIERFEVPYRIGSDAGCDLQLNDATLPSLACELMRVGAEIYVRNPSAVALTVGGKRVPTQGRTLWRAGHELACGQSTLDLQDPVAKSLSELEALSDEVVDEAVEPPGGEPGAEKRRRAGKAGKAGKTQEGSKPPSPKSAPASSEPRTPTKPGGWDVADWVVASFACVLFGVSLAALLWLFE